MFKNKKSAILFLIVGLLFVFYENNKINYCISIDNTLFNKNLSELDDAFLSTMNNLFYKENESWYEKYSYEILNLLLCDNKKWDDLLLSLNKEKQIDPLTFNTIAYISRSFPNKIIDENRDIFLKYINRSPLKIWHTKETDVIDFINDATLFTNQLEALTELKSISVSDYTIEYLLKNWKIYESVLAIDFSGESEFSIFKKRKSEVLPLLNKWLLSQDLSDIEKENILIFIESLEE